MNTQENAVTKVIKDLYASLVNLVGFIISHTSDQLADIAIRALPILIPVPNAIGIYFVSQSALGFSDHQALAFALAIECALFGLSEVVLMMFDGLQDNEAVYRWPFRLSVGVATLTMILIILIVYWLETAHPILAVLPLFSAAGAAALALRRWDIRNKNRQADELATARSVNVHLEQALGTIEAERQAERDRVNAERQAERERMNADRQAEVERLNELRIENARLAERASAQANAATPGTNAKANTQADTDQRRRIVLDYYRDNPGVSYQAAANDLGIGKTTVYNAVQFWEKAGTIHVNGNGVEVVK
ncbi:MAG: hypothetical protein IPL32_18350 [Chloracidobacterium sp.]|nr:hypothetical protein [Chloracidobacterium sp.]